MSRKFYIIDGTALSYRSYFAFIRNPLITSKGENTSAVFGFTLSILRLIKEEKPDYLVITFDSKEPTFRHKMYPEYKATREKMPNEIIDALPRIDQVVDALRIPTIQMPGYEADDIMGTLAYRAYNAGLTVYLVTGDKDLMQLVNDRTYWFNLRKTGEENEVLDPDGVREKFGVLPEAVIDVLGLMGDTSDNIPGVAGVGKKTAVKLIDEYHTLENVLENIDAIPQKSLRERLAEDREQALLSRQLVIIDKDVPLEYDLESYKLHEPDTQKALSLFKELEFSSLIDQLPRTVKVQQHARNYHTVVTCEGFATLIENLKNHPFVFDLETTGLDAISAELVGFSFSWAETEAYYLPVTAPDKEIPFSLKEILDALKPIFKDPSMQKCGHNAKYDIMVLNKYDIEVNGLVFDTMIAAYLIEPDKRRFSLDDLSLEYLNITKIPISDLIGKGKKQIPLIGMREVPLSKIAEYACEDADCTFQLWKKLEPILNERGLKKLFTEVEMPLIPVLIDMELTGVTIDVDFLKTMSGKLHRMMEQLTKEIYELAGEEFNIGSPQQLGKILFEKLRIQKELGIKRVRKTKIGYSTDISVLEQYRGHPIVERILEHRQHSKLLSTYVDALPKLINRKTGRIHTSFNQTVAATGRLSSTNPNLQNIPIRTTFGREIRKAFVPRSESWELLSADYSQIELRIMAHMSGDEHMREAFINGEDIHSKTAASIFGIADDDVIPEMRYKAKAINFGIIYGMSPYRLARETGITNEEAQDFITAYFAFYPGVHEYIVDQLVKARGDGYVTTLMGRMRNLPELYSDNKRVRRNAENIAINTPIQGTAAELIKIAMINLSHELKKGGYQAKLLMQIHDELLLEAPHDEVESLKNVVKECMKNTIELSVPLVVEVHSGHNWFEAH